MRSYLELLLRWDMASHQRLPITVCQLANLSKVKMGHAEDSQQ